MYVQRNTEAQSRNHCCHGKAVSITYLCVCVCGGECMLLRACVCGGGAVLLASACARVALLMQHATRMHLIVCGLSGSITFFEIIS